jgi:hypothetical protein
MKLSVLKKKAKLLLLTTLRVMNLNHPYKNKTLLNLLVVMLMAKRKRRRRTRRIEKPVHRQKIKNDISHVIK